MLDEVLRKALRNVLKMFSGTLKGLQNNLRGIAKW